MGARGSFEGLSICKLSASEASRSRASTQNDMYKLLYAYRKLNFVSLHLSLLYSCRKPAEAMIQKFDPPRRDVRDAPSTGFDFRLVARKS